MLQAAHQLLKAVRLEGDRDSGRGTSEDEYGTPVHHHTNSKFSGRGTSEDEYSTPVHHHTNSKFSGRGTSEDEYVTPVHHHTNSTLMQLPFLSRILGVTSFNQLIA